MKLMSSKYAQQRWSYSPSVFCTVMFGMGCALLSLFQPMSSAAQVFSYHIGNSLTFDSRPDGIAAIAEGFGFEHSVGRHIRCGSSLDNILANPDDTCVAPLEGIGNFGEALSNYQWDAVTLQPHFNGEQETPSGELVPATSLSSDVSSILNLISQAQSGGANEDTMFYVYAAWSPVAGFESAWTAPVANDDATASVRAREYYQHVVNRVRDETSAKVNVIPVGEVLYELSQRIEAGQVPGIDDLRDFYRDSIHLTTDIGRYTAGITTFATIYGIDPAGSVKPEGFYGNDSAFTPALYDAIHAAVWDVISSDRNMGAIFSQVPEPQSLALFILAFVLSVGMRFRSRNAVCG